MKKALFPGSFDPITLGHVDIIKRAYDLFDEIVIGIGTNSTKQNMFSVEQRRRWIEETFKDYPKISVSFYSDLTVKFCQEINAQYIIRGLRDTKDFEFEKSIGQMNRELENSVETIYLITDPALSAINASIVRDIIKHGGDISKFVPKAVKP
ncbi:MAG TPA: pantetheine-phosphate adenylyltransferase [Flavobacteriales bacterium]|nr:pantetheine-phosphate adenylyltransferase [Flavobacteriales bacterium]|tara:strand:- start:6572 stop:7027 length:456 start_codon:yes stop_codon:yes gene_type:complete